MPKKEKLELSDIPRLVESMQDYTSVLPAVFRRLIDAATSKEEKKALQSGLQEAEKAAHIFKQAVFPTAEELEITSPAVCDVQQVQESLDEAPSEKDLGPELIPPAPVPHPSELLSSDQ